MGSRQNTGSSLRAGVGERWTRLDRGWQAVVLGLLVVGVQWLLQAV